MVSINTTSTKGKSAVASPTKQRQSFVVLIAFVLGMVLGQVLTLTGIENGPTSKRVTDASFSLASKEYPLANPPSQGHSLLKDRGVVAGSCEDSGWPYVMSFAEDKRTPEWDVSAVKSHRLKGHSAALCGYGFPNFFQEPVHTKQSDQQKLVMLDIGANMGISMLPFWAKGWRIIAFEPIPDNIANLRRNVFINGIDEEHVALIWGAVTNVSGINLDIYAPKGRTDNTALSQTGSTLNVGGSVDVYQVPAVQIDTYLATAIDPTLKDQVALIKIDTQGHELSVLQGMQNLLRNPPTPTAGYPFVVIAEYDPALQKASGHEPHEMLNFMRNMGYEVRCSFSEEQPIVPPSVPKCADVIFSKGKPVIKA